MAKLHVGAPPPTEGWRPLLRGILDPPVQLGRFLTQEVSRILKSPTERI